MSVAATQSVVEQPSGYARFLSQLLSDRERLFAEIESSEDLGAKLAYAAGTLTALTALYGASAGAYAGPLQAIPLLAVPRENGHFHCGWRRPG